MVISIVMFKVDVKNNSSDKTYTVTTLSKEENVENHKSVLSSVCLSTKDDDCDFGLCTEFLNSTRTNKQRFIAGSAKCSTKPVSKLLTSILTEEGLQFLLQQLLP